MEATEEVLQMLPQTLLLLAVLERVAARASLAMLAMAGMEALTGAQVVVAAQGLIPWATLAQAAMEQTALLWLQPTSKK